MKRRQARKIFWSKRSLVNVSTQTAHKAGGIVLRDFTRGLRRVSIAAYRMSASMRALACICNKETL